METESASRKAAMAWSLVMVFEGRAGDGGVPVGRGRAPALQAKRNTVRKCIVVDIPFFWNCGRRTLWVCFGSLTSTVDCR